MEDLAARHGREQKDLQSRITQKKKQATKKTRKGITNECELLEQETKSRQAAEIAAIEGRASAEDDAVEAAINGDDDASQLEQAQKASAGRATILGEEKVRGLVVTSAEDQPASQAPQRKPNRQKARLARRAAEQDAASAQAAEEAANIPDMKTLERNKMLEEAEKHGLVEKEVAANGHCLYLAVADQMLQQKLNLKSAVDLSQDQSQPAVDKSVPDYKKVRAAAADYISAHPDDFEPFLEEPLSDYLRKVRDTGEWGGQLELTALAKAYNININILQASGRLEKIEAGEGSQATGEAWLAYYRHGFGLGEHYNSLRKEPGKAVNG